MAARLHKGSGHGWDGFCILDLYKGRYSCMIGRNKQERTTAALYLNFIGFIWWRILSVLIYLLHVKVVGF